MLVTTRNTHPVVKIGASRLTKATRSRSELIQYDNGVVGLANQFVFPAYNRTNLPARDVPKRWEDLLDPKWKGGKLGVSTATHHLSRLAVGPWGEAKTLEFVTALSKQEPILGTLANLYSRLQVGEILAGHDPHR